MPQRKDNPKEYAEDDREFGAITRAGREQDPAILGLVALYERWSLKDVITGFAAQTVLPFHPHQGAH